MFAGLGLYVYLDRKMHGSNVEGLCGNFDDNTEDAYPFEFSLYWNMNHETCLDGYYVEDYLPCVGVSGLERLRRSMPGTMK